MTPGLLAFVAAITAVKLLLAPSWGWTNDIQLLLIQATGHPVPYPTGNYAFAANALWLARSMGLPFVFWMKVPAILADVVVALVMGTMARGGRRVVLAYLLSPVSILLSAYHGQVHTVATAAAVIALWAADRERLGLSGIALALAVGIRQHFGILIIPLVLRARSRWLPLAAGFTLAFAFVAIAVWGGYSGRLVSPHIVYGAWGYGMLLLQGPRVLELLGVHGAIRMAGPVNRGLVAYGPLVSWIWIVVFIIWVWRRRSAQIDLWRAALVYLVGQYVISPGFGVQWLIWALPLWLVVDWRGALIYSGLAGAFLAGSYWQWSLNAAYGVASITANLSLLRRADLIGVVLVGCCGLLTWAYCARSAWRFARG
ncbi:MAG: hypothetical protein HY737_01140 [Candidatus Omnitrophica bacterium]|nr:hypothetical protein [Candidatus Omnitrophota bacterium]